MILRTVRQGPRAGSKFWGCAGFPGCRGTVEVQGAELTELKQIGLHR